MGGYLMVLVLAVRPRHSDAGLTLDAERLTLKPKASCVRRLASGCENGYAVIRYRSAPGTGRR